MHFGYPYSALREANVGGTIEVLRLACAGGRLKRVHYVSTLSVFGGENTGRPVGERAPLAPLEGVHGGYSQSKWVSEQLLALAAGRGVPVTVYRPVT